MFWTRLTEYLFGMSIPDFVLNWILNWIIFRPDSMKKWNFKTDRPGLGRGRAGEGRGGRCAHPCSKPALPACLNNHRQALTHLTIFASVPESWVQSFQLLPRSWPGINSFASRSSQSEVMPIFSPRKGWPRNGRLSPIACHIYLESLCINGQFSLSPF